MAARRLLTWGLTLTLSTPGLAILTQDWGISLKPEFRFLPSEVQAIKKGPLSPLLGTPRLFLKKSRFQICYKLVEIGRIGSLKINRSKPTWRGSWTYRGQFQRTPASKKK